MQHGATGLRLTRGRTGGGEIGKLVQLLIWAPGIALGEERRDRRAEEETIG